MPLLNIPKVKKESTWVFNHTEQLALKYLPEEQVKSANHDVELVQALLAEEQREPEPALVRNDVIKAFDIVNVNPIKALAATAHLSVDERNKVIRTIAHSFLRLTPDKLNEKNQLQTTFVKLLQTIDVQSIDLFDFIIKFEAAVKNRSKK